MHIEIEKKEINPFIKLPKHINASLKLLGRHINNEKIKKILDKFRTQFPEIDEKSYKLLKREDKKIGKNFIEVYKEQTEFNELINYSFFSSILHKIKKKNKEIKTVKIYNTYGYTDRKTGVDYTIFIELKNGTKIAFGIDLKNGRNVEKNFNEVIPGIFGLITQNLKGEIQNYINIKKNIEISKELYKNVTKHRRKYTIGINYRNQESINETVIKDILTTKLNHELESLRIFGLIEEYIIDIIKNEIEDSNSRIFQTINYTRDSADKFLDTAKAAKAEEEARETKKKRDEIQREKRRKQKELTKKEKQKKFEKKKKTKKYETGKNYTQKKYREDLLGLSDMSKKPNIEDIAKNIKSNKKLKEKFIIFYNESVENNEFKFEYNNRTNIVKNNPKKPLLNRFKKLYELVIIVEPKNKNNIKDKNKQNNEKKYTVEDYHIDLLVLSDMTNKLNITNKMKKIAEKIKNNKKIKEIFIKFYNKSIKENKFNFIIDIKENNTIEIQNPKKTFINRFSKLYNIVTEGKEADLDEDKQSNEKKYTVENYHIDLLVLSDMTNKLNITTRMKKITDKIKSNKELKEKFSNFYLKSLKEDIFIFETVNGEPSIIKNPKKTFLNRFKKIYDLVNEDLK